MSRREGDREAEGVAGRGRLKAVPKSGNVSALLGSVYAVACEIWHKGKLER